MTYISVMNDRYADISKVSDEMTYLAAAAEGAVGVVTHRFSKGAGFDGAAVRRAVHQAATLPRGAAEGGAAPLSGAARGAARQGL